MLKKIIAWIQKNKLLTIWILAVAVVSGLLIWALIGGGDRQPTPVTLIQLPLNTDQVHQVNIRRELIENSEFPTSLEIFPTIERNYSSLTESFLQKLGKNGMQRFSSQGAIYTWTQGDDYVEYIPNLQTLYFRFNRSVDSGVGIRVGSPESANEYIKEVIKKFLDRDYTFTNVTARTEGVGNTRIQANRVVNGLPLYISTYEGFSDYLVIDSNGYLLEGRFLLVESDESKADPVRLVHASNLQSAIRDSSYPKTIVQGPNQLLTEIIEDAEEIEEEGGILHGHVDTSSTDFPIAQVSTASSIELVYLYSDSGSKHLSPVYKLNGEGFVNYEGNRINMPIVIYANAIDPDRVYIPD